MAGEVIETVVDSDPATVKAIRATTPMGVGGVPIQRIPYNAGLESMVKMGVNSKVLGGTTRCIRVVDVPLKGEATGKFHCSRACVGVGGMQLCPEHDKEAFQPNQTSPGPKPAVTNSSMIKLTAAEMSEIGATDKLVPLPEPFTPQNKVKRAYNRKQKVIEVPMKSKGDKITITLNLDELSGTSLVDVLKDRIIEALDSLPATNIARMKQVVALQEKVARIASNGAKA